MTIQQLKLGDSASHSKTISETDVYLFAGITGDLNPAHVNESVASASRFGGRIAHGILSAGLISAVLAMQLPFVKGRVKKGILAWNTSVHFVIFLMLFIIIGSLGDYLKTQVFPIYAATSIAEIGMFKRLDALFLGIWTTGLFAKMALFLYLISLCIQRIWGRKAGRWSIAVGGVVVVIGSVVLSESRALSQIIYDWRVLLPITLLVSLVIPIILLIIDSITRRTGREESHA